ncbi:MAG: KH domain-containing protein [Anaerolineaceae bacterium]|nr:KH domain-containing protein [Anaerolineaceae bacterium]
MKELVELIANQLVEDKSQVVVKEIDEGGRIVVELQVSKEDMGRVIGKGGRVANSIRILLRVAAAREGKKVSLDIIEP